MHPAFDYTLAFMAGILGSAHCIGMCGGLVSAFFLRFGNERKGMLPYLAYHGARVGMYTVIGMISALIGMAFISTDMLGKAQSTLQIIAGLVVILLGFDILGLLPRHITFGFLPLGALRARFIGAAEKGPVIGALIGGGINGVMPCPLTLAVAVKAATAPSPLEGGMLMLVFGLGTLPSMLLVSAAFGRLGPRLRSYMMRGAAVFVILLGVNTTFAGIKHLKGGVHAHHHMSQAAPIIPSSATGQATAIASLTPKPS